MDDTLGKGEVESSILSRSTSFPGFLQTIAKASKHQRAWKRIAYWQELDKVCSRVVLPHPSTVTGEA